MSDLNNEYVAFAANVSFLELGREEFGSALIDPSKYDEEIRILGSRSDWAPESLSEFIRLHPGSFKVLEAVLQQQRFTHAQLIHFFFDVVKMNSLNVDSVYQYALLNIDHDRNLLGQCEKALKELASGVTLSELRRSDKDEHRRMVVAVFKMAVSKHAKKIAKDPEILKLRVCDPVFKESSYRLSDYVIHRLRLNDLLGCTDLQALLKAKRAPLDTKGMHGDYGKMKVAEVLERNGYLNIDAILNGNGLKTLKSDVSEQLGDKLPRGKLFCTERFVEGIIKPKEKKPKKFDVIIFTGSKPRHLFEVNFYTTSGTKIGINEGEYVDLREAIGVTKEYEFHWITDGNYWLSPGGRERYERLLSEFGSIYNINTFEANLNRFS
jgi:hypothetical protein